MRSLLTLLVLLTLAPLVPARLGAARLGAARAQAPGEDKAALEARFAELLNGCRLVGRFTDDAMAPDAPLPEDAYTISRVEPLGGDRWRFTALVEFGKRSVPISIEVDVLWAGDTPVISLTDFKVPLLGTYSARVLFRGDRYAGTWSGAEHGGHMFGRVVPLPPQEPRSEDHVEDEQEGDGADADRGERDGEGEEDLAGGDPAQDWPSFRGPRARGYQEGYATPTSFDPRTGENVRWTAELPGLSHASPVVGGNRLFVVTSVPADGETPELKVGLYGSIGGVADEGEQSFVLLCYDKRDGRLLWERTGFTGKPAIQRHPKGSHAASSPATDGRHVVAFYGSEGLHCYDADGNELWSRDFGVLDSGFYMVPTAQWGFSSSPVIHGDLVLVQCDVQGQSFVAALRLADGEEVWRTDRDEVPTWSTPTVYDGGEGPQVILNGYKHIGGYDLATGAERWRLAGGGDIPVPTPIVEQGLVFITNAHGRMAPIYAIDAAAEGELETSKDEDGLLWYVTNRGNYMQTPLLVDGVLYCCADQGVLTAYDAFSGEVLYRERLGGGNTGFTSSGVAADGKLYFASEVGEVHVVRGGPEFEVLAVNDLGEECMATPAVSEGTLFYRTRSRLTAVGLLD